MSDMTMFFGFLGISMGLFAVAGAIKQSGVMIANAILFAANNDMDNKEQGKAK